jgi:hypothetical protein
LTCPVMPCPALLCPPPGVPLARVALTFEEILAGGSFTVAASRMLVSRFLITRLLVTRGLKWSQSRFVFRKAVEVSPLRCPRQGHITNVFEH